MSSLGRLDQLLAETDGGLDRIMAVIASVDRAAPPTEDDIVARLDELSEGCGGEASVAVVLDFVFGTAGFVGDVAHYYDPANSLIHRVLDRRRGIPLTLAAVAAEVGRRRGVDLRLIGMPGHVLLGEGPDPDRWFDPFGRGAELGMADCRALFARFHPIEAFRPTMLLPMSNEAVAIRMLNNLRVAFVKRGELDRTVPVLELRAGMASATVSDRAELANLLTGLGRFDQAAQHFDVLVELDPERADTYRARAMNCRAHRN